MWLRHTLPSLSLVVLVPDQQSRTEFNTPYAMTPLALEPLCYDGESGRRLAKVDKLEITYLYGLTYV